MFFAFRFLSTISLLLVACQSLLTGGVPVSETGSVQGAVVSPLVAESLDYPVPRLAGQSPSFLHVQGRQILDASGQPVLLRGVNMDTYYYSYIWDPTAPWSYATQADIQYLDSLGVTAIRLGFHWRYFETLLGFDLIDAYLNWCEQAGIYVILDMHVVPPEDDVLDGRIWNDPAAQQQFLNLWSSIAARYAARTIVAGYDLYNEPAPPAAAQWWNLARRAVAAIRAVDANHIIFVENPLIEDAAFQLMTDPNVVYSFHDYSPFVVSHAGADWVGDSPVPDDYSYPGPALTGTEWADWAPDAAEFTGRTTGWKYWDSGLLTVPSGVEFATLKLFAGGNAGAVWFDDLELEHNGVPQTLYNPGMENASNDDASRPANWFFWSDSGFSGEWSDEYAHSGNYSLKITSDGNGFGVWTQPEWILVEPLFRVQAGDTFRVRGWIYAPQNNGGSVSLSMDYLNGVYENYDRAHLLADMLLYIDWAAANNVPLHVGEFGSMSAAPGNSRYNLVADKISVMNEAGLHWAMWTYRDPSAPGFGLYHGGDLDEPLADILRDRLGNTFADVPLDHPLYAYIEALYDAGYTAGCSTSPLMFCPDTILDRAQSAVFMLRGQMGGGYTPPPAPWDTFADDWTGFEWAEPWAEGMWDEGLTQGCQTSPLMYCPATQLPRVEASVFGLRMKYGVAYTPPSASGTLFADFPSTDPSYWAIDWAERAYLDGLLPACGTQNGKPMFCPSQLVNRGWGAYLIVKAKNLPLP